MKRIISITLILLLLTGAACAETRESVIYLEGEPEPVTETLYETPWGFSFWYDADLLTVDESMSENGYSLTVYPTDNVLGVYMEIMLPEAIFMDSWEYLESNTGSDTEYESYYTDTGTEILGYVQPAFDNDVIQGFYAASSNNKDQVAIFIYCLTEAWEGWGHRLLHTLQTITFGPLPAIRADWGEDYEVAPSVTVSDDEYSTWVLFSASRPVSDFKVLALDMNDEFEFEAEPVYSLGTLTPGAPVRVSLAFYGDIPNNGISFVDEDGTLCRYAVDMSGEDGSLYLWAF